MNKHIRKFKIDYKICFFGALIWKSPCRLSVVWPLLKGWAKTESIYFVCTEISFPYGLAYMRSFSQLVNEISRMKSPRVPKWHIRAWLIYPNKTHGEYRIEIMFLPVSPPIIFLPVPTPPLSTSLLVTSSPHHHHQHHHQLHLSSLYFWHLILFFLVFKCSTSTCWLLFVYLSHRASGYERMCAFTVCLFSTGERWWGTDKHPPLQPCSPYTVATRWDGPMADCSAHWGLCTET